MSNNPGNNNRMYTSTPLRKNKEQLIRRSTDDDNTPDTRYNQNYYSIPRASYNNNPNRSSNSEYQSLPSNTYNSTIPDLLNENELQLVIEPDTEETRTNYKTPDTSLLKSNFCHPLYFENAQSTQNTETDTDYINIPLNIKEYNKPSTSSGNCSDNSSTICSKNKKFIIGNSTDVEYKDLQYFRGRAKQEYDESEEEYDDFPPKVMPNVSKDPRYLNNETWNPNYKADEQNKKMFKPHISMETYPSSTQHLKKNRRTPANVPFIKEDDYQQIPQFLHNSDLMDPSQISSASNEKTLDSIYMKYPRKEDLSAKSDSINMLSVVISTVMLLASRSQIPQNYITWTLKYLKCIKNKQGQYPPNIKKLQKMLMLHTGASVQGQGKGQEQNQEQWQCMNFLAGKNPGKRMDLTKKRRK